jgi:general secretion pathway protein F
MMEAPVPGGAQTFAYRALDRNGADVQGRIEATGDVDALRMLSAQGLTPLEVRAAARWTGGASMPRRRVRLSDCAQLLQELGTLLKGGVALGEALPSLAEAYRGTALEVPLAGMDQAVRGGMHLSQAIREARLPLPGYALALIEAGEASGQMSSALEDIHRQMAYESVVRQEIRNALTYPAILVLAGLAAILIVFVGVVPRFAGLLRNSRADVPEISRWVIEAGLFAKGHLLAIGLLAAAAAMAAAVALGQPAVRGRLLDRLSRFRLTRDWILPAETGRWATLFSTLLANRVPLLEALRLSRDLVGLSSVRRHLDDALREVRRGRALSAIFAEQGWLGPTQVNLIRVGERSGQLPRMLQSLGELQTDMARQRVKRLLTLLEPAAILLIGVVIGFIMVAVMLAITSLNTSTL